MTIKRKQKSLQDIAEQIADIHNKINDTNSDQQYRFYEILVDNQWDFLSELDLGSADTDVIESYLRTCEIVAQSKDAVFYKNTNISWLDWLDKDFRNGFNAGRHYTKCCEREELV